MFKVLLILLFILTLIYTFPSLSLATKQTLMTKEELNLNGFNKYESLNPNLLVYPFKTLSEQIRLFLLFDKTAKLKYSLSLLDLRFNELVYIINFKKTGFLNEAIGRYNTQVGKIKSDSNLIDSSHKIKYHKDMKLLEILRDKYPANSAYWLNIQQAIDTIRSII